MKLGQYVYGRRPNAGLQVIARSRELPFFNKSWMDAPRYGSAPVRETQDRIWTRRYEVQCFEDGALLSCMYPLKQTDIPCGEQKYPYIRGITPAVQHLLIGTNDLNEFLEHLDAALYFDDFFHIDDIYRLSGDFLEPIDLALNDDVSLTVTDTERAMCLDMAAYLWRAFVCRKDGKLGELSRRNIMLIVPGSTPQEELEVQRRVVAYTLRLLPPCIRRWTSVTLNLDAESETLPGGSALYAMTRANPESDIQGRGIVFDLDREVWPAAEEEEKKHFIARQLKSPIVKLDQAIELFPQRYQQEFHIKLMVLLDDLCHNTAGVDDVIAFIQEENLTAYQDLLCEALADAVFANRADGINRKHMAVLWSLCEGSPSMAGFFSRVDCPLEEALAIVIRDDILTGIADRKPQDELFCDYVAKRATIEQRELSVEQTQALYRWAEQQDSGTSLAEEKMLYALLMNHQLEINTTDSLDLWLDCQLFYRMHQLPAVHRWEQLLDELGNSRVSQRLLCIARLNENCSWTTAAEKLIIDWFNNHKLLPEWTEMECNEVAKRVIALKDLQSMWPVLLMRCAQNLGKPIDACAMLLRNQTFRMMPDMQIYVEQYSSYVQMMNAYTFRNRITSAAQVLQLIPLWEEVSGEKRLLLTHQQYSDLVPQFIQALSSQSISELVKINNALREQPLPDECQNAIQTAIARCIADRIVNEELLDLTVDDLEMINGIAPMASDHITRAANTRLMMIRATLDLYHAPNNGQVFKDIREFLSSLAGNDRSLLQQMLVKHMPYKHSAIFLASTNTRNSILWSSALHDIAIALKLPDESPDVIAKRKDIIYDSYCSMIFSLFQTGHPSCPGTLLMASDRQELAGWLRLNGPHLVRRLQKEYKKFGDLPYELVEYLSLEKKR